MSSAENRVIKAASLIMAAMVASRVLGYVRDVVIYAHFGQNRLTDAYNAAFSIPDFVYLLLVGGALSSAFIPTFSAYLANDGEEEAWEVASIVFNVILAMLLVAIAAGVIFTPQLVYLLVPGFDAASTALTVSLTRIMFIQVFFMALSGLSVGVLNSYKHFLTPAIGSVLYNLGTIVVGVLLAPRVGIMAFSIGVVVGAAANIGVQLPELFRRGLKYRLSFRVSHPGVVKIFRLMFPVLIGLSVAQFNVLVNQNLASTLSDGAVAALRTGQRLMMLPVGIFAISVAIAAFPDLSGQAARGEMDRFRRSFSLGLRSVLFLNLPAAAGLIAMREPVVRLLYETGKFTSDATQATAGALLFYSLGLFAYASMHMLNRAFYALQNTRVPVIAGISTIVLNIVLNYALIRPLGPGGLALAYSVAGIFNMGLLLYLLRRRLGSMDGTRLLTSFSKSLLAALVMGLASYWAVGYVAGWLDLARKSHQLMQVGAGMAAGVAVYVTLALIFKMEEAAIVWGILARRRRKSTEDGQKTPGRS